MSISKIKLIDTMKGIMSQEGKLLEKDPSRKFLNTHNHFVLLDYDTLLFSWNDAINQVKASNNPVVYIPDEEFTTTVYNEIVEELKINIRTHVVMRGYSSFRNIQDKIDFIRSLKTPCLLFDSNNNLLGALITNFDLISKYVTSIINKKITFAYAGNMRGILNSGHVYLDRRREYRTPIGFNLDNLEDVFTFLDYYISKDYDYFINRYFSSVRIVIDSGKQRVVEEGGEVRYIPNKGGIVFYNLFSNIIDKKYQTKFSLISLSNTNISKYTDESGYISIDNNPIFTLPELKKLQDSLADHFRVKNSKIVSKQAINKVRAVIGAARTQLEEIHKPYSAHTEQLSIIRNFSPAFAKIGVIVQVLQSDFVNSSILAPKEGRIKPEVLKKLVDATILGKGSPSTLDYVEELLVNTLKGKRTNPYSDTKNIVSTTKVTTGSKLSNTKATVGKINSTAIQVKKLAKPSLRNLQGQFLSLTNLEALLRAGLQKALLKNMHRPNLRNQTGRFRESVKLEKLSRSREGHKGYYPSRLINQSVRELAATLTRERFHSITIK